MKRLAALALLLGCGPLGGCAWLLGEGELLQPRSPLRAAQAEQTARVVGLSLDARFLGVGDRVPTARNPLGRLARVVNPYGDDTWVFALDGQNGSDDVVVLLPQEASLQEGEATPHAARTLDAYRRRWPNWAAEDDEQIHDQGVAYDAVLNSLLLERRLAPGASCHGRLAFPGGRGAPALTLRLPLIVGTRRQMAVWHWAPR